VQLLDAAGADFDMDAVLAVAGVLLEQVDLPRDPVVHADVAMLPTPVAPPAFQNAPQARECWQVEEITMLAVARHERGTRVLP
jgi:hypothetical protein